MPELRRVDKHSRNSHKLRFAVKSLTFSYLICALNLYFAQKLLRRAKLARGSLNREKLLQTPNVAQKLSSKIGTSLITFLLFLRVQH